jgi:rhodanese-related sulfurtransferase
MGVRRNAWRPLLLALKLCVRLFEAKKTEVIQMAHAARFLALVNEAKKRVKETNVDDVKRRMDAGEKFVLVDVREESEWAQGHLPGAIHLGKGIIERDIEQRVPDTATKMILYCGGGFRSALTADNLQKMGYSNVESMDGGWKGWIGAGLPTQKG